MLTNGNDQKEKNEMNAAFGPRIQVECFLQSYSVKPVLAALDMISKIGIKFVSKNV